MYVCDLIQFFGELFENNNCVWFVMNKLCYDILCEEFLLLIIKFIVEISKFDLVIVGCNLKKVLFCINCDMCFFYDKCLYKMYFLVVIMVSGFKKFSQGGGLVYYFYINEVG